MRMEETLLLYLVVGLAVGAALALRDPRRAAVWLTAGFLFWPLFLPLLLAKPRALRPRSISELDSLRGEVERLTALLPELGPLGAAVEAAAGHRAGMEDLARLLRTQEEALAADEPVLARNAKAGELRETRLQDLERIRSALDEQEARYLRIISRVREAVTQGHLARYSAESRRDLAKQMARLADELGILSSKE